jgi:hypothetical protein
MMEINVLTDLIGKTLTSVERVGDEELIFKVSDSESYKFYHEQDCCESVTIEDIIGDLDDLVGSPLLMAEETSDHQEDKDNWESVTWTFYKFATLKGYVTVRWCGSSNGYYSESVYFTRLGA